MRKILSIFAAALVAIAVSAQTDFADPGYSCAADDAVLTVGNSSHFYLDKDADPHHIAWADAALSENNLAAWTVTATRGCYVTVSLDLGPVIASNKHIFEVKILDDKSNVKGTLAEPAENTDANQVKELEGTILLPVAGTYTVELRNNRDWGKGSIKNVILTYAADAPSEIVDVTSVELNKSEVTLDLEEVELLVATVSPDNATDPSVTWETSDAAVATVNENGLILAVAEGTATITAKAGEQSATCAVTVAAAAIPDVDFSEPCVLAGKVAHLEGAIWKNEGYKLYGDGGSNKNYGSALWTINVTHPCIVSAMLNGVEGGHLFELDLYKGEEFVATIAQPDGKTWSAGEIALEGTLTFDEAAVYTLKLRNTQEWSSGKVAGVTLTFVEDLAPAEPKFYVAGSMTSWGDNKIAVYEDSYTLENLAAATYQLKVVDGDNWLGYDALTEKTPGLFVDDWGNVNFTLAETGNVTVTFIKENDQIATFTVTGDYVLPSVTLAGQMNGWNAEAEGYAFTPAEDKLTASLTVTLEDYYYEFKIVVGGSLWMGKETGGDLYELNREWNTVSDLVADKPNLVIKPDIVPGEYTFIWTFANNALEVIFPEETPVEEKWDEIIFEEAIAADDIAADASFTVEDSEFAITITDPDNKMSIDANDCRFGTEEAYTMYHGRLKSGGKSSSTKNFMTANIPAAGKLRIAVRTGKNADTDRNLVIKQGESELYNQAIVESMAIEVQEGDKTVNVYPFVEVEVAAGSVQLSYPTNGLNFYSFAFKADGSTSGITNTEVGEKAVKVFQNGQLMIIKNGVKYNVLGMTL